MFISFSLSIHHSSFLHVSPSAWSVHLRHWKPERDTFVSCERRSFHPLPSEETLDLWFLHISASFLWEFFFWSILSTATADMEAWPLAYMWPGPGQQQGGFYIHEEKWREEKHQMQMDWSKFPVYLQSRHHVTSTLSLSFCYCNALRS